MDSAYWRGQLAGYQRERQASNPLFGPNRLKLGVFAANCSGGMAFTTAEDATPITWPQMCRIAQLADAAGFEAMVPVARWRGFGENFEHHGRSFETYTFAAGLSQATQRISVFSTSHVPTMHPIVAAKQATTIDHISGGRFALNIVCGWSEPEFEMFGAELLPHDQRYAYAQEWLEIVRRLWTCSDQFDFEGRCFHIKRGFAQPKPVQRPMPPIMNAGASATGKRFMAQHADIAFTSLRGDVAAGVAALKQLASEEFGRSLQVWSTAGGGLVVCAPTEKEARQQAAYYLVERLNTAAAVDWARQLADADRAVPPAVLAEQLRQTNRSVALNAGLIGTPEQIASYLTTLAAAGLDGLVLHWVDYAQGLQQWIEEILPLLEQAGLRQPVGSQT